MAGYFEGKVAVVTGASSGFGLGISERLLQKGASCVYMAARNRAALEREAQRLNEQYFGRAIPLVANITVREDIEGMIDTAVREAGRIDFLFNNAGQPKTKMTELTSGDEFNEMVQLNLMGVVYGTLAALKAMLKQGSGHIINTASLGGLVPVPFQCCYGATKAAVIEFTRCLALEYCDTDIHFTQFSPANVATPIFKAEYAEQLLKKGKTFEEIEALTKNIGVPEGALALDTALDIVFAGIEAQKTDIYVAEAEDLYRLFCHDRDKFDQLTIDVSRKRRAYFEEYQRMLAAGENPLTLPFPG